MMIRSKLPELWVLGLLMSPLASWAQSTDYSLEFANDTVNSGAVTVNSAGVVTSVTNMSLDFLVVQSSNGGGCQFACQPPTYDVASGELDIKGNTLTLYGSVPQIGQNATTPLLVARFAAPLTVQQLTGPGPQIFAQFPEASSLTVSHSLLADLGILGNISDETLSGGIFATRSQGKYLGFDGETDLSFIATPHKVPEVDPSLALSAFTILAGGLAILRARGRIGG